MEWQKILSNWSINVSNLSRLNSLLPLPTFIWVLPNWWFFWVWLPHKLCLVAESNPWVLLSCPFHLLWEWRGSPPFPWVSFRSGVSKTPQSSSSMLVSCPRGFTNTGQLLPIFFSCLQKARSQLRIVFAVYGCYARIYSRILCALATVIYFLMARTEAPIKTKPEQLIIHLIILRDIALLL